MKLIFTFIITLIIGNNPSEYTLQNNQEIGDSLFCAVYYSNNFEGRKTRSGEIFRQKKLTCASNYFVIGDKLKLTNLENQKSVIVRVNDSGNFKRGTLDLSKSAFMKLSSLRRGKIKIKVQKIS